MNNDLKIFLKSQVGNARLNHVRNDYCNHISDNMNDLESIVNRFTDDLHELRNTALTEDEAVEQHKLLRDKFSFELSRFKANAAWDEKIQSATGNTRKELEAAQFYFDLAVKEVQSQIERQHTELKKESAVQTQRQQIDEILRYNDRLDSQRKKPIV